MTHLRNTITAWIDAQLTHLATTVTRRVIARANARIESEGVGQ